MPAHIPPHPVAAGFQKFESGTSLVKAKKDSFLSITYIHLYFTISAASHEKNKVNKLS